MELLMGPRTVIAVCRNGGHAEDRGKEGGRRKGEGERRRGERGALSLQKEDPTQDGWKKRRSYFGDDCQLRC
eukprot:8262193-Pyramimonas_sp.AAC.1